MYVVFSLAQLRLWDVKLAGWVTFINVISQDLQKAWISNFACDEHVMGGQGISSFSLFFVYFFTKLRKIQFLHWRGLDNSHVPPAVVLRTPVTDGSPTCLKALFSCPALLLKWLLVFLVSAVFVIITVTNWWDFSCTDSCANVVLPFMICITFKQMVTYRRLCLLW